MNLTKGTKSFDTSDKRVVNLTRSHFPGQQRYSTIVWSGDTMVTWDTFRKQFAGGLNLCVTSNPKWIFDIGGVFCGAQTGIVVLEWRFPGEL